MIERKFAVLICGASAILIAFLATNLFWVMTVTYAAPVAEFGEKAVFVGFEAASKLLRHNGFKAYLDGMSWFFVFLSFCSFISCILMIRNAIKYPVWLGFVVSIIGSLAYFMFSVNVYEYDSLAGQSRVVCGLEAIKQSGYAWSLFSWLSIAAIFFASGIISMAIVRYWEKCTTARNEAV